jgi:hypothetical protein
MFLKMAECLSGWGILQPVDKKELCSAAQYILNAELT